MKVTLISTAALALGIGLAATAACAQDGARLNNPAQLQREHNRAVAAGDWANDPYNSRSSDDLNRQQLANSQAMAPPVYADTTADTGADYSSDQQYSSQPDNTTITVVGPAHDVRENSPDPDTNPQATGTPSIDTPYAVPPGTPIKPDDTSSGMYQPQQ